MIAQKADESIEQAVAYELQNIVKKYGAKYHSTHEAYAVLKEEVEEAQECLSYMLLHLGEIWKGVKDNNIANIDIEQCKQFAIALAEEAVQCAAVCERFEETIKGGKA